MYLLAGYPNMTPFINRKSNEHEPGLSPLGMVFVGFFVVCEFALALLLIYGVVKLLLYVTAG